VPAKHKLTIAYIANQFPSPVEPYFVEEIEELRRRGVEVIPCSVWHPQRSLPADLDVLSLETLYFFPLRWRSIAQAFTLCIQKRQILADLVHGTLAPGSESSVRRIKALLHTWLGAYYALLLQPHQVEHIHVHHGYFAAWIAMVAARLLGIQFTMTLHGSDLLLHSAFMNTKLQNCAACFTISEFNRKYIRERFPNIEGGKITLRRLGVAIPSCDFIRLREPGTSFTILAVGRLHAIKNHTFLLQAFSLLKQRGIKFLGLIAGDGPERQHLCRLISRLNLQREVKLLGHVPHADLDMLYPRVDLVVLTSRSEGIPLALMEAMAHAKPVLAPDITGIPELVEDGKTGFLYEPGSLQDFISRIEMIQGSAAALVPLCRATREHILTHFNREQNLRQFVDNLLHIVFPENTLSHVCVAQQSGAQVGDRLEPMSSRLVYMCIPL
jgi:colanic acid/amylovoran biosynthesis glycosyltransferase